MKTNQDRTRALNDIAETATMLTTLAAIVLDDIAAARGEPEQDRHTRPRLHADIRDPDATQPPKPPAPEPHTIDYGDPTGARATKDDPASRDLAEIDKRLTRARTDMGVVLRIFERHQTARTPAQIKDIRTLADGELDRHGDDWCRSHLRVATLEPVELQKSGAPYYAGMCRRCGSLLATLKKDHPKRFRSYTLPPIELVTVMTYRRIRQSDVDALVGPQHRQRKATKHKPGEDRKRRTV